MTLGSALFAILTMLFGAFWGFIAGYNAALAEGRKEGERK